MTYSDGNTFYKQFANGERMFWSLKTDTIAFPFSRFPLKPDGNYDDTFKFRTVIYGDDGPFWECHHQVALVKLYAIYDYITALRTTPNRV